MRAALRLKPDIVSVLKGEGLALEKKGRTFWALCPLHDEKNPSFGVNPERQTFHCFGCRKHGDVITFVRERYGLSFIQALEHLGMETSVTEQAFVAESKERKGLVSGFRTWEQAKRNDIAFLLRVYREVIASKKPLLSEADFEVIAKLQGEIDYLEYRYDILCGKNDKAKYEIFREDTTYGDGNLLLGRHASE